MEAAAVAAACCSDMVGLMAGPANWAVGLDPSVVSSSSRLTSGLGSEVGRGSLVEVGSGSLVEVPPAKGGMPGLSTHVKPGNLECVQPAGWLREAISTRALELYR